MRYLFITITITSPQLVRMWPATGLFSTGTVHIVIMGCVPWQLNASDSLKEGNPVGFKGDGYSDYLTAHFLQPWHPLERTSNTGRLTDTASIGIQMLFGSS